MNIEEYEFSDMFAPKVLNANKTAVVLDTKDKPWVAIYKDDVIALAQHFNLTTDDLKGNN